MKQIKKTLSIFLLAIFIMASILSNVTVKAAQEFRLVSPIINYVGVDHSPLVVGDTEKFTVTSKYEGMVQYRAFLFDGKEWNELTSGYSEAVDAKTPYVLPETKPFKLGKYKLSVWVKAAGETGISSNKNYDNYYVTNLNCTTRDNANRVYANGDAKVETKGLTVKVNGIENIGGIKGPYLYRLFVFNPTSGIWSNGAKEYTSSPTYTFDEAGTYMVIVHANTGKSTTWKNYLAGKTKGAYEAWKTVVVTVKNEEIVKVIDTTVKAASFGSAVNVTLTNEGVKYFSTATKYKIFDGENELSAVTNLGTATTVFPSKVTGDKVKVKLLDEGSKEIKEFNVLLGQSGTITVTPPVAISSVNAINGKEVEIKFNTPVNPISAENVANYKITASDGTVMYIGKVIYLNPTTVRATLEFNHFPSTTNYFGTDIALKNGSSYKLTVSKYLLDVSGKAQINDLTSTFTFTDKVIPTITKVSVNGGGVLVNFSEPIKINNAYFTLKLLDKNGIPYGNNLIGSKISISDPDGVRWNGFDHKTLIIDVSSSIVNGARCRLSIVNKFTDYAGNSVPFKSIDVTNIEGDSYYAEDKTAPKILSTNYISQKFVDVTFNKPISISRDNFYWNTDGIENNSENSATSLSLVNATTYRVEFSKLMAKGNDFLFIKGIQDNYGNKIPTTKVPLTVVNDIFEATAVDVNPGLNATSVDGDEYFTITFSNNIDPSSIVDGWNGTNSKNISLIATKGKGEDPDTLSLGNAGTITFHENAITAGGSILGTVSMPSSNQIKVTLGNGATSAKFVPTGNDMFYNASPALASVDEITINSNILIRVASHCFLTVESLTLSTNYPPDNNFSISNNYGANFDGTNVKINTKADFGVSTAVTSSYKGAEIDLTATSVSITRAAGSGVAIAAGETLYLRAEDGPNKSDCVRIVFNKAIEANGAVTNADFTIK